MLLTIIQASLIKSRWRRYHRTVGYISLAIAAILVLSGLQVLQTMILREGGERFEFSPLYRLYASHKAKSPYPQISVPVTVVTHLIVRKCEPHFRKRAVRCSKNSLGKSWSTPPPQLQAKS